MIAAAMRGGRKSLGGDGSLDGGGMGLLKGVGPLEEVGRLCVGSLDGEETLWGGRSVVCVSVSVNTPVHRANTADMSGARTSAHKHTNTQTNKQTNKQANKRIT